MEIHDDELKKIESEALLLQELQGRNMTHLADEYIHKWQQLKKPSKPVSRPKKKKGGFKK